VNMSNGLLSTNQVVDSSVKFGLDRTCVVVSLRLLVSSREMLVCTKKIARMNVGSR